MRAFEIGRTSHEGHTSHGRYDGRCDSSDVNAYRHSCPSSQISLPPALPLSFLSRNRHPLEMPEVHYFVGERAGTRTRDLLIKSHCLLISGYFVSFRLTADIHRNP